MESWFLLEDLFLDDFTFTFFGFALCFFFVLLFFELVDVLEVGRARFVIEFCLVTVAEEEDVLDVW